MLHFRKLIFLLPAIAFLLCSPAFSQGVNTDFGQNRLPFKDMKWQGLSSENVDAYYYEGGKNLAAYALLAAEENVGNIEDFVDYRAGGKIQILIFNTIEDLRQSNTGLKEQLFNVGGYTYVVDNKVIAYYNGSHSDFETQIKRGIAEIVLSEMIYGSSVQERVQSSSLLFLPSWFFKGLTSYMAEPWSTDIDSRVRDGILSGKFKKFNLLSEEDAILAGHSLWNYIARKYGEKNIPEILYLTRISKGYEAAFSYALGVNSSTLIDDWFAYYQNYYRESEDERSVPRKLLNIPDKVSGFPHTALKTHPNGRRIAFVMNKDGFWQVKIFDKREKKEFTVFKGGRHEGYQVINYSYPILAWEPNGKHLGVMYYDKGKTKLVKIDKDNKIADRFTMPDNIDQVLSFDFADANTLLISAIKNGQTDLYLYTLSGKELTQLTNDIYDDLWPRFNADQTELIFSSNRPYDSLNVKSATFSTLEEGNNFDVFLYNYATQDNALKRITNTPYVNEIQPVFYLPGYYSFVSDISGIYNAYACKDTSVFNYSQAYITYLDGHTDTLKTFVPLPEGDLSSVLVNNVKYDTADSNIVSIRAKNVQGGSFRYFPLTNYKRNILYRDMASTDDAEYNLLFYDDRYQIFETNVSPDIEEDAEYINIVPTEYRLGTGINFFYGDTVPTTAVIIQPNIINPPSSSLTDDTVTVKNTDSALYYFQTDFPEDFILNQKKGQKTKPGDNTLPEGFATPSKLYTSIFPDYYVSQLDNSVAHTYYNINSNGPGVFSNMNIMFQAKASLTDLLGNHRITAGVRYPFSLNGSDYFIQYQNRKHRLNWEIGYFRQSRRIEQAIITRLLINEMRGIIKIPFNETTSLRLHAFGRQDRNITLGTDSATLNVADTYYSWAGTKAELVIDNTKNIDINLPYGTRFKLFTEFYQDVNRPDNKIINLGIDYRKYIKLHNKIIWATRFAANTSIGPSKVLYYIGGVENWIGPSYNGDIARAQGQQYIFQSLANNMRGFKQNIRNGSSYALINTEVRFPVAAYITQKPVRADYLRHFMLVPFVDIGSAWYGSSPFKEQPYNTRVIDGGGYIVTLTSPDSPIVGAYGIGMRTRILSYYLRLDFSWGVLNGRTQERMTFFALGYDF